MRITIKADKMLEDLRHNVKAIKEAMTIVY